MRKCRRSPAKLLNSSSSVTRGTLPGPGSSNKGFEASVRQTARTFRYERTSIIVVQNNFQTKKKERDIDVHQVIRVQPTNGLNRATESHVLVCLDGVSEIKKTV